MAIGGGRLAPDPLAARYRAANGTARLGTRASRFDQLFIRGRRRSGGSAPGSHGQSASILQFVAERASWFEGNPHKFITSFKDPFKFWGEQTLLCRTRMSTKAFIRYMANIRVL